MQAILILTGLDLEARALARWLALPPDPSLGVPAFGPGVTRAAPVGVRGACLDARWTSLVSGLERPLVISAGLCGALDPELAPGALVVPERVIGPLGDEMQPDGDGHRRALAQAPSARTGSLVTTEDVVATPRAKSELRARSGAIAVDMESAAILRAAAAAGFPSVVVRGVSDHACQELPRELIDVMSPEGRLRIGRAGVLIAHPAVLPQAFRLRRATMRALRAVAQVLAGLAA